MLRALRIAVSVVSGLCCVLVIVLWVRSHWRGDIVNISGVNSRRCYLVSINGELRIEVGERLFKFRGEGSIPELIERPFAISRSTVPASGDPDRKVTKNFTEFRLSAYGLPIQVIPHWFVVLLAATLSVTSWVRPISWRFSLRTLLLVTTAVVLLLGLIIYATRG